MTSSRPDPETSTLYATDGDMNGYTDFYIPDQIRRLHEASLQRLPRNNPDGTRNPAVPIYLDADNPGRFMLDIIFTANLESASY